MPTRVAIATGNWTAAATWSLFDSASFLNSETGSEVLTTAFSGTRSAAFTPDGTAISHIAVKLSVRTGTTGTMTVGMYNASLGLDVAATEVTINCSDLPVAATADANGGWILFKLSSPFTPLVATTYAVQARTSTASMVSLFRDGTADNIARLLVLTTTGAPVAGDDLVIAKEWTAAGTGTAFTVTMNETAATDYGAASTSLVLPTLAICNGGSLTWAVTAATAFQMKLSGNLIVYSGGTYNQGTVASPCPRDSSMDLFFDCVANVDFGFVIRNGGTAVVQGLSRTIGKLFAKCFLNTDEAANSTSLGVDTDTGWLDNDEIVVASTTRTAGQSEAGAMNGAAAASVLTVDGFAGAAGGLLNAHSGTSPTQGEIILLTRNVIIRGTSATLQSYVDIKPTATVDCDWARFKWLGSGTISKRGIDNAATTGVVSFEFCSLDNFVAANSFGYYQSSATAAASTFSNNVLWNITSDSISNVVTSASTCVISGNVVINSGTAATLIRLLDVGGTFSNNTFVGGGIAGTISEANTVGTMSGNTWHSAGNLTQWFNMTGGTISNTTVWRMNAVGVQVSVCSNITFNGITMFGNNGANLQLLTCSDITFQSVVFSGDSTFSTTVGVAPVAGNIQQNIRFIDSTFGVVGGIKTAHTQDVLCVANYENIVFENCLLASASEVASQSLLIKGATISSQKHDQTAGLHRTWKREGTLAIETTAGLFDVTPGLRLTPLSASEKLNSDGRYPVLSAAVANGGTLTVGVKVRESVVGDGTDYNGSRIRLIVKRNAAAGIASDTVLATATVASEGAFETVSGTTIAVTDDAVLDFMVDCDGTTGWINVDTFTVNPVADSKGQKFWQDGQPVGYGDNSSGGSNPVGQCST